MTKQELMEILKDVPDDYIFKAYADGEWKPIYSHWIFHEHKDVFLYACVAPEEEG